MCKNWTKAWIWYEKRPIYVARDRTILWLKIFSIIRKKNWRKSTTTPKWLRTYSKSASNTLASLHEMRMQMLSSLCWLDLRERLRWIEFFSFFKLKLFLYLNCYFAFRQATKKMSNVDDWNKQQRWPLVKKNQTK